MLRQNALDIMNYAFAKANPYTAVTELLKTYEKNDVTVIAAGKAAVPMAKASYDSLGKRVKQGIVLTKYGHLEPLPDVFEAFEAGHPVPDENSVTASQRIVDVCTALGEENEILFMLSGGASALFELPYVSLDELKSITGCLLGCGADITEINTVRKRLSKVKGGKFAAMCRCHITCVILSDVIGNRIDAVASGPCCADPSTVADAQNIAEKYSLPLSEDAKAAMMTETPKEIANTDISVVGDVNILCRSAAEKAEQLGYHTRILTSELCGEARDSAEELALKAVSIAEIDHVPTALICGGETTVTLRGKGLGGRNQEMALSAAKYIDGYENIVFLAAGSDGTDGPTDAAGGITDGNTKRKLSEKGISIDDVINNSDSYHGLEACGCLIRTGATGTNVNDLTVILIN